MNKPNRIYYDNELFTKDDIEGKTKTQFKNTARETPKWTEKGYTDRAERLGFIYDKLKGVES